MADTKTLVTELILENGKFNSDLQNTQKNLNKTKVEQGELTKGVTALKGAYIAVAAALTGIVAKALGDAVGAFQKFRQSTQATEKQFGKNADVIIKRLRDVSKGTVDNASLIESANRAMALNVTQDLDQMAQLLEVARVRGQALGVDTTQAFNDIVTGIGRGSPLILDNLGIITKGWAEEAKAAGQAFDTQFILNKVLSDGAELLERTGENAVTGAERMQQITAGFKNLQLTLGGVLSNQLARFAEALAGDADIKKFFDAIARGIELVTIPLTVMRVLIESTLNAIRALAAPITSLFSNTVKAIKGEFNSLGEFFKSFNQTTADEVVTGATGIKTSFTNAVTDIVALFSDAETAIGANLAGIAAAAKKSSEDTLKSQQDLAKGIVDTIIQTATQANDLVFDISRQALDRRLEQLEEERQARLENDNVFRQQLMALDEEDEQRKKDELEREVMEFQTAGNRKGAAEARRQLERIGLEEKAADREKQINKQIDREQAEIKKKQFIADKFAGIGKVAVNTAVGITRAFDLGPIAGAVFAAIIGALGAAQTAVIAAQPIPKFQRGGFIRGLPGGGPGGEDGLIAAQNGEAVLNRPATAILGEDAIDALNQGRGISNSITLNVSGGQEAVDVLNDFFRTQGGGRDLARG